MSISTSATINTVVNDTNYRYISFTTIGSTSLTVYDDLICDILIVGGGGGGGQVLYYTDNNDLTFKTDNSITLKKGSYTINIGAGGNVGFNDGNDGYSTGTTIICSTNVKGSSPYYN
jgi:asparagine N-glycosylation enzyme membrane subunit Stt3